MVYGISLPAGDYTDRCDVGGMMHNEIVRLLRSAVMRQGISVSQIAKNAGIPQQVLQRFVCGQRDNLRLDTAVKLMSALELAIVDPAPIRDELLRINSQLDRWESIRNRLREVLPNEFVQLIDDLRAIHEALSTVMLGWQGAG
jgi:hypothetical protein